MESPPTAFSMSPLLFASVCGSGQTVYQTAKLAWHRLWGNPQALNEFEVTTKVDKQLQEMQQQLDRVLNALKGKNDKCH